jgi:hypothetical protein
VAARCHCSSVASPLPSPSTNPVFYKFNLLIAKDDVPSGDLCVEHSAENLPRVNVALLVLGQGFLATH